MLLLKMPITLLKKTYSLKSNDLLNIIESKIAYLLLSLKQYKNHLINALFFIKSGYSNCG